MPDILPPNKEDKISLPNSQESVHILRRRFTPKQAMVIKAAMGLSALAVAGWLAQNFLQLRGFVNLTASRIDLFFLAIALILAAIALTIGLKNKRLIRICGGIAIIIGTFAVDRWTPKPPSTIADAKIDPPITTPSLKPLKANSTSVPSTSPNTPRRRLPEPRLVKPIPTSLPVEHIKILSSEQINSSYDDAPFGLKLVIGTDIPVQLPVTVQLSCNKPIIHSPTVRTGSNASVWPGTPVNPDGSEWSWRVESSSVPFSAENPWRVFVFAKEPITCNKLTWSH